MSDDKVYTPIVINETPFPQEDSQSFVTTQSATGGTSTPATTQNQQFPKKIIAQETIASAFNTKSRKILQSFQFADSGAIQVGNYQEGITGDIRISPTGILARDTTGSTTVAIDGETGDAIFKGILQAGSVIAGDNSILMEEAGSGGGRIVLYDVHGIPSIIIGDPS